MSQQLILIPHIKVHNANALSSPFTIGFPAMTGFMGMAHALERKLNGQGISVTFSAVGVISHHADLQTHKGNNDFVHSIIGTGNPLDKTGARSAFIEEARIHLDVSLLIEVSHLALEPRDELIEKIRHLLNGHMKLAGGDIMSHQQPQFHVVDDDDNSLQKLQRQLMPGYALIERRDLLQRAQEEGLDALDGLIDFLAVHNTCTVTQQEDSDGNSKESISWTSQRKTSGWIVPIATGFQGISELGAAKNQRDESTPHRFAESVVTLGEFKMPHRIKSIDNLLWRYQFNSKQSLYLCEQKQAAQRVHALEPTQDFSESEDDEF